MLTLRQRELASLWGLQETGVVRDLYEAFLPVVLEHGDAQTLYWTYFSMTSYVLSKDTLALIQRAKQVAQEIGDEFLYHLAEAGAISYQVDRGLGDETTVARITELIDYLERKDSIFATTFHFHWALSNYYLSQRAFDKAIACGLCGLNMAKAWRHLSNIGRSTEGLATIYLQMDQTAEAARYILDDIDWHLAIGQRWQTLGALWSMVNGFTPLFGGGPGVVPVLSMAYHHPDAPPYYRELITVEVSRFEEEMGAEAFTAAWEKGKALDFETAVAQTRAKLITLQGNSV